MTCVRCRVGTQYVVVMIINKTTWQVEGKGRAELCGVWGKAGAGESHIWVLKCMSTIAPWDMQNDSPICLFSSSVTL